MIKYFAQYKTATAWTTLVMFMLVISTGVVENCVCADDNPQRPDQCENDMSCCCSSGEKNEPDMTGDLELTFSAYIQSECQCGSDAAPFTPLGDFLNAAAFDITGRESSNIHTLSDTIHLSTMILSRHKNHAQELCIPGISITSIKTTVLLT